MRGHAATSGVFGSLVLTHCSSAMTQRLDLPVEDAALVSNRMALIPGRQRAFGLGRDILGCILGELDKVLGRSVR